jgi:hypothetical protein
MNRCPDCGANLALVGRAHRCIPKTEERPDSMPRKKPETSGDPLHSMAGPKKPGRASKSRTEAAKKTSAKGKGAAKQKAAPAVILAGNEGLASGAATSETPKHPGGRPSDYRPEYARMARVMCRNGATDAELAEAFDVDTTTIWRWQAKHDEFCNALKVQKGEYDERVKRGLAQRAAGYTYDAVKIFMPSGASEPVYARYREHVPPDPGAAKIWLCNRQPEEWRDRRELTGADGTPLIPVLEVVHTDGRSQVASS